MAFHETGMARRLAIAHLVIAVLVTRHWTPPPRARGRHSCGRRRRASAAGGQFLPAADDRIDIGGVELQPAAAHEHSRKTTLFITPNIDEALILADRIIVMSARPGRVKAELCNTLPRPRHIDIQLSPDYARLKSTVWSHVEQELLRQMEATAPLA